MNSTEAKKILLAWRPGHGDLRDPQVAAALEHARRDPALNDWLARHGDFQRAMEGSFRQIRVPGDLRDRILARSKIVAPVPWWRKPAWLSAAAAVLLLLGATAWWLRPASNDSVSVFRSRMVSTVLRQYAMDIVTNDRTQVRAYLAKNQAPFDYSLPEKLNRLPLLGAGVLSWRGERVSMVCLDSTNQGTLFLFIVSRSAVRAAPAKDVEFLKVNKLMTATWTQGGTTYVLAGSEGRESLREHFN